MKQHKKLMIPGPVDIFDETLDALAEQALPHNGADWSPIYWETLEIMSGAGGALAGQVMRIDHMGRASTPEYLIPFLLGIEEYVRSVKEVDIPVGASLIGLATAPLCPQSSVVSERRPVGRTSPSVWC